MGEIKIEVETLRSAIADLNTAISSFEGYVNNYVNEARDSLDGMHSNFVSELGKTLDNMRDDSDPKTLNEVKSFSETVAATVEAYVEADAAVSGKMAG